MRIRMTSMVYWVALALCAGCTASSTTITAQPVETPAAETAPTAVGTAEPDADATAVATAEPDADATAVATAEPEDAGFRYRWTASLLIAPALGEPQIRIADFLTVDVDRTREVALLEVDYTVVPEELFPDQPASSGFVAYVDGVQIARGLERSQHGWFGEGEPDPGTWYEGRQFGEPGLPDIVPGDASGVSLFGVLGVEPDDAGRAMLSADAVDALGLAGDSLFAGLARADLEPPGPLLIDVASGEDGRVAWIRLELLADDEGPSDVVEIVIEYDAASFDVPERSVARPVPGLTMTEPDPVAQALEGDAEVALRLNLYLARSDDIVLTPDNTLIRVGTTDVFAGPADFEQWQLTRTGSERLLRAVLDNPVVASGEYNVHFRQGVGLDIGPPPSELNAHPDREPGPIDRRADIEALIELLDDPTWLGDDILSGPEPWVPETLTVIASPAGPSRDLVAWPFPASIRDSGEPGTDRYADAIVVCLSGDDVLPVWNLLGGGVNHAHLGLDDGETWDANVLLNWPGYRLLSDPCGPDYERYLQVTGGEDGD